MKRHHAITWIDSNGIRKPPITYSGPMSNARWKAMTAHILREWSCMLKKQVSREPPKKDINSTG